jgi:hypothetical protein
MNEATATVDIPFLQMWMNSLYKNEADFLNYISLPSTLLSPQSHRNSDTLVAHLVLFLTLSSSSELLDDAHNSPSKADECL